MTEDDNEVEDPFQNRLTNDRNKSPTTFVKPVMPANNMKKQSTNRSSRKVETSKPGFINVNNSQTLRGNSAEITRFNQYNETSGLIPGSSHWPYTVEPNTTSPSIFTTDSHATSNLSMTGDTASAVASGEPNVLEAVLMESGYNYGTSENPNDSQTNHREISCFYEQETCMSQNQVHEKYDNGAKYSWGYIERF